ncbi:Thiosulfate reductase cytochrome B subunit [Hyphomicrobium sulfonivorans]|uniref:Thiosulfate reductase cytochrome B subunit n=1 Tax=Hyphomicrobium sulfonivorans TaxID=121290 RepID=A0A125NVN9_HYPSL|nr:cytochrome b/b6 domain-containing protein [Hyphomicrobium sulfonivorans]KWT70378.1 Thiosulfate reductase cytochrome B subunit [Hyphomicrobium sulfonivorans]
MTPLWLRLWHWTMAVLFTVLVVTGVVLTHSTSTFALINYALADTLHQVLGIAFSALFVVFLLVAGVTGHWRRYQRQWKGLLSRIVKFGGYVINGVPVKGNGGGEAPPRIEVSRGLLILVQNFLSIFSIAVLSPLLAITGLALLFPEYAPEKMAGLGGVWPFAIAHYWVGLLGVLFLLFHAYIATIAGFRRMIKGR